MARNNGNNTVTVEKGDTLWSIAETFLGAGNKYQQLADINNISNPNLIHVNQVLKLSGSSSTSSTASNTNKVTITAFGLQADSDRTLFATWTWSKESQTKSYLVIWEYYSKDKIWLVGSDSETSVNENYYASSRQTTYNIPENAEQVRFRVKPLSKEKGEGNNKTTHFTAEWTDYKTYNVDSLPPYAPQQPTVKIDKYSLTASIDSIDAEALNATHVVFQIIENDTNSFKVSDPIAINKDMNFVSWKWTVGAGNNYKVRCKSRRGNLESEWSASSSNEQTIPSTPSGAPICSASAKATDGSYSVYVEWEKVYSADTYVIQHTTKKEYFDNPTGSTTDVETENDNTSITLLNFEEGESGGEYFFRVCAKNEKGSSGWSEITSVKIGEPPAAPTTWSSTTTAIVGEPLSLYWQHNSEDGSNQTWAQLVLKTYANEEDEEPIETAEHVIKNDAYYGIDSNGTKYKVGDYEEGDEYRTSVCLIDTNKYDEGVILKWQVCTAGVTDVFGEWSDPRQVDIYAPATLTLSVTDEFETLEDGTVNLIFSEDGNMSVLESFPFFVKAVASKSTVQSPVGYHLSISANESYDTVDRVGNSKTVSTGEQVYSKYFDTSEVLLTEFSAGNIDLENNISYTITCNVSMSSGITALATSTFTVSWVDVQYIPNAEIAINEETYSASIRPYCEEHKSVLRRVTKTANNYTVVEESFDDNTLERIYTTSGERVLLGVNNRGVELYYCAAYVNSNGAPIDPVYYKVTASSGEYITTNTKVNISDTKNVYTTTGEEVLLGSVNGSVVYYSVVDSATRVSGVTLAVYRREFDGGFTEIASGIDNTANTFVTDPHPALDYARYRIVATTDSTGAVSYYDLPGHIVGGKAVIIQWSEEWSSFDKWSEDPLAQPTWSGSLLKLPYNIDVSDSNSLDVTHVKYIGRKRPVTYYGTQLGETSTWNVEIEKSDEETIYALRRLSLWMGDVYVREPSGTGYWANIAVSFSQKHREMTIPVTLNITRVEGGI